MKPTPPPAAPQDPPSADGLPKLVWRAVSLGAGAAPFGVYALADPNALLDAMDDASFEAGDERMPYYALLWPSGEALASALAAAPPWTGLRVLDLGCGVAAEGLAAARLGACVTCLDWAPEAAPLVARSAERLGVTLERFLVCDWRRAPDDLGLFDRILGADLLYEARNAEPVARFLREHLTLGGEAWLADPGRLHARDFPARAAAAGLRLVEERPIPSRDVEARITLWRLVCG